MKYEWVKPYGDLRPISASCVGCVRSCHRKWMFKYRWGLFPKRKEFSPSASLGKLVHRFQEVGPDKLDVVKLEVIEMQKKLMAQVDAGEDLDGSLARKAGLLTEIYDKALAVSRIFWEAHPEPPALETIGKEIKWECSVILRNDLLVPVMGIMDKVQRTRGTNDFWVRDTKTTGRAPLSHLLTGYQYSAQCRFYRILVNDYVRRNNLAEGTIKVGFVVDAMLMPTIKKCAKDDKTAEKEGITSFEAYMKRVKEWYEEKGEDASLSWAVLYGEDLLPIELDRCLTNIMTLRSIHPVPDNFDRDISKTACTAYQRVCDYYSLCNSDPLAWESIVEQQYEWKAERNVA